MVVNENIISRLKSLLRRPGILAANAISRL